MKAMIVDDSGATRFILSKMMSELGYDVVQAKDGQDAYDKLNENTDCVIALVDWNMPVMNGYDLVCKMRSEDQFNDVKIMMVTTETEMTQVVKAIEAGANEYIMKPFTKEMILDKMKLLGVPFQE
ncbi:MAG: response regulator [Bdellovibrionales bacterium]|nr:response regulator [Bdellovibrionales bacterium]